MLQETFENWIDIFSKESERPHVELKESELDVEYLLNLLNDE